MSHKKMVNPIDSSLSFLTANLSFYGLAFVGLAAVAVGYLVVIKFVKRIKNAA